MCDTHFRISANSSTLEYRAVGQNTRKAECVELAVMLQVPETRLSKAAVTSVKQSSLKSSPCYAWKMPIIWSLIEKLISREKSTYIFIISKRYVEAHVDLFYGWIWPCSMCTCILKTASSFSTECIIFARLILISGWWSPDYTASFYCISCWSLQEKKKKKETEMQKP